MNKTDKKNEERENSRASFMPGRTFFITSLCYLVLGCFSFFYSSVYLFWFFASLILIPVVIIDLALMLLFADRFRVEREIPSSLSQNTPAHVKLFIHRTRFFLPGAVRLYDLYPSSMSASVFPVKLKMKTKETQLFEYTLMPDERGPWYFTGTEFLLSSFLHFWRLRVTHDNISRGRTYPNFKQMARGVDLKGNPENADVKNIRKRGQGLEFESLRDYQEGDSIRSIDWRATSRNRTLDGRLKLIVRNYEEEQDQQILFIIDSGYRLPDEQFDSALEAMHLLSYVALKHGDSVAAASFGARDLWIPPRKGMKAYTGLMNELYDLHSAPVPSSPFSAIEKALTHLNRRSFIILISNFREEDGESLSWILPRINKKHLLLMVSFREDDAEKLSLRGKNKTDEEVLETAAAYSYLANRRRLYRKWEHSGLLILETSPSHISSALINKYLSVKKSGKL
ncbi:MAG: DUF58 domain-containing protein [Treponema sp.]|nr:DUF58 domain-containing protein [Treponema sp.]MCL2237339.1 DUF58 domain-containing protein [Treponema sp.]